MNVEQGGWRGWTETEGEGCKLEHAFTIDFDQPTLVEKFIAAKLKPTDVIRSNSAQNKNRALHHLSATF